MSNKLIYALFANLYKEHNVSPNGFYTLSVLWFALTDSSLRIECLYMRIYANNVTPEQKNVFGQTKSVLRPLF